MPSGFMLIAFSKTVAGGELAGWLKLPGAFAGVDVAGGATPLVGIKERFPAYISGIVDSSASLTELPSLLDMFLGKRGGAIGEGCAIALIIGFIYLALRRVIKWQVPVAFVGTVFVLSLCLSGFDFNLALYSILAGGVLFAGIFMVTDYSTTPINTLGKVVFAIGAGIITVLIRCFGNYPEGASFGILLMNILSPYIEKLTRRRPFGGVKKK